MKKFTVRVGWPPSHQVFQEIVSKLVSDDWVRRSTEDESDFYYIVGQRAQTADGEEDFSIESIPISHHVGPSAEANVHAQIAAAKPWSQYVDRAATRLEATGVKPTVVRTFVKMLRGQEVTEALPPRCFAFEPGSDSRTAFWDLLQALTIERGSEPEPPTTEAEERTSLAVAVQKMYLLELSRLYEGVVRRAGSLEALHFSDPQLNEASRSYLYGFFRATVLLSASAVESCLRDRLSPKGLYATNTRESFYGQLVRRAVDEGILGVRQTMGQEPVWAVYCGDIFSLRNNVAHRGYAPGMNEAEETLTKARQVVDFVRG